MTLTKYKMFEVMVRCIYPVFSQASDLREMRSGSYFKKGRTPRILPQNRRATFFSSKLIELPMPVELY
jgi:hypothetical protein